MRRLFIFCGAIIIIILLVAQFLQGLRGFSHLMVPPTSVAASDEITLGKNTTKGTTSPRPRIDDKLSNNNETSHRPQQSDNQNNSNYTVPNNIVNTSTKCNKTGGRSDIVLVLMCNKAQVRRMAATLKSLQTTGKYSGDVVILHAEEDLSEAEARQEVQGVLQRGNNNATTDGVLRFRSFSKNLDQYIVSPDLPGHGPKGRGMTQETAWIYFFKFNVLDPFFASHWCRLLYVDAGIRARGDITTYLKEVQPTTQFYAHSDAFPTFEWKLSGQFHESALKDELQQKYELDIDYPQSTLLYFNTAAVIEQDPGAREKLFHLQRTYPVGLSLDQPYIALYYTNVKPIWEELPTLGDGTRFYDYIGHRPGVRDPLLYKA